MIKPDSWALSCARLVMTAARLEGLTVALREDGATVVRGGSPSASLSVMLFDHSEAIAWLLAQKKSKDEAVRRTEVVTCARSMMPAEVDLPTI